MTRQRRGRGNERRSNGRGPAVRTEGEGNGGADGGEGDPGTAVRTAGEGDPGTAVRTEEGGRGRVHGRAHRRLKMNRCFKGLFERHTGRPPSKKLIPPLATTLMTPGCNATRVPQRWSSQLPLSPPPTARLGRIYNFAFIGIFVGGCLDNNIKILNNITTTRRRTSQSSPRPAWLCRR